MTQQVLITATSYGDFQARIQEAFEKGYLMVGASLRIEPTVGGLLLGVIMEKQETVATPPVVVPPVKGGKA